METFFQKLPLKSRRVIYSATVNLSSIGDYDGVKPCVVSFKRQGVDKPKVKGERNFFALTACGKNLS